MAKNFSYFRPGKNLPGFRARASVDVYEKISQKWVSIIVARTILSALQWSLFAQLVSISSHSPSLSVCAPCSGRTENHVADLMITSSVAGIGFMTILTHGRLSITTEYLFSWRQGHDYLFLPNQFWRTSRNVLCLLWRLAACRLIDVCHSSIFVELMDGRKGGAPFLRERECGITECLGVQCRLTHRASTNIHVHTFTLWDETRE